MSVNKKSITAQALKEMRDIQEAIKEESKSTIKALLSEAVKDALRESADEDDDMEIFGGDDDICPECGKGKKDCECGKKGSDDKEEKSEKKSSGEIEETDGEDPQAEEAPQDGLTQAAAPAESGQAPAEDGQAPAMNAPVEGEGGQGQDDFMAQYQAGDEDTLDLTGEQDINNVLKVYKALSDDDQVVVKQDGGKINLQDNGTGAEYIIDLGGDEAEAAEAPGEIGGGEDGQLAEEDFGTGEDPDNEEYNPKNMKDEVLFEIDLGYTDNYQDKDPIDGLSNSEPSKSGRSWHKGVPTGTEKPWAGKGTEKKGEPFDDSVNENLTQLDDKYFAAGLNDTGVADVETEDGMPFDKKVGEVDEATNVGGFVQQNSTSKSHVPNSSGRDARSKSQDGARKKGTVKPRYSEDELNETIKKLKAKNRKLNETVNELAKGFQDAHLTNVCLGRVTKLFLENATTQAERLNIVERFANEAKTPEQAQTLYESISKQLAKAGAAKAEILESKTVEKKVINENKAYKSQDLLDTIDLMNRVLNC